MARPATARLLAKYIDDRQQTCNTRVGADGVATGSRPAFAPRHCRRNSLTSEKMCAVECQGRAQSQNLPARKRNRTVSVSVFELRLHETTGRTMTATGRIVSWHGFQSQNAGRIERFPPGVGLKISLQLLLRVVRHLDLGCAHVLDFHRRRAVNFYGVAVEVHRAGDME